MFSEQVQIIYNSGFCFKKKKKKAKKDKRHRLCLIASISASSIAASALIVFLDMGSMKYIPSFINILYASKPSCRAILESPLA